MATILIVEDDVFILEGAVLLAEDMGHDTLAATDIEEALLLLRFPQHIDALITDIRLKTAAFGGFELAHQAGKSRPNLPVLYTTGSYVTSEMTAMSVGGAHFLRKPYTQLQFQNSIEEMLLASV